MTDNIQKAKDLFSAISIIVDEKISNIQLNKKKKAVIQALNLDGTADVLINDELFPNVEIRKGLLPQVNEVVRVEIPNNKNRDMFIDTSEHIGISYLTNKLNSDVAISVANTWYTGASIALTEGTWLIQSMTTVLRPTTTEVTFSARISDGTNHFASAGQYMPSLSNAHANLSMSTIITLSSTTNILLQVTGNQTGTIKASLAVNGVGNNSTQISAIKIAQ